MNGTASVDGMPARDIMRRCWMLARNDRRIKGRSFSFQDTGLCSVLGGREKAWDDSAWTRWQKELARIYWALVLHWCGYNIQRAVFQIKWSGFRVPECDRGKTRDGWSSQQSPISFPYLRVEERNPKKRFHRWRETCLCFMQFLSQLLGRRFVLSVSRMGFESGVNSGADMLYKFTFRIRVVNVPEISFS